jgi:hypothetical protein
MLEEYPVRMLLAFRIRFLASSHIVQMTVALPQAVERIAVMANPGEETLAEGQLPHRAC